MAARDAFAAGTSNALPAGAALVVLGGIAAVMILPGRLTNRDPQVWMLQAP